MFRVELRGEDMVTIAERMKAMQEQAPDPIYVETEVPLTREELRARYNALSKRERSAFGSFARYEGWRRGALYIESLDPYATPAQVDKVELPPHVYLSPAEATPQQKAMAIGRDEKGNYAVAVEDLTAGQIQAMGTTGGAEAVRADQLRAEYIERTMGAHARLNGADGKPTSNADDSGGVPG